jgi:L-alanine-DL-glutamate epimerase-like enolase superfamily enzyme
MGVESAGADLRGGGGEGDPGAAMRRNMGHFAESGRLFYDITELSALRIPTISIVFGSSTAGGAYQPGMSDYNIFIRDRSKVFLGGPPLVKVATGEDSSDEELGGAEMHCTVSGLGDYLAMDEMDALRIARDVVGPDIRVAVDANQRWDVDDAVAWIKELAHFDLAWVEEPTSPDDVLGHAAIARAVAPIPVATGEHIANRVMFKQFLQQEAMQVLQMDATRVAGVNENIAILLLAAKFGVPVCPHAGGVGLCEAVQHLAMFDFVAVSGRLDGRVIEFVDHLHEHFVTPVEVRGGRYRAPTAPGAGTEMYAASLAAYRVGS